MAGLALDGTRQLCLHLAGSYGVAASGSRRSAGRQKLQPFWPKVERFPSLHDAPACTRKHGHSDRFQCSAERRTPDSYVMDDSRRGSEASEPLSGPLAGWRALALPAIAAAVVAGAVLVPSANAADALKTCTCLLKECRAEFARCLGDVKCATNIACLQSCNGRPDETECQIRCGDLFENSVVDEFNTCAVSKKQCVPQKPDENLYPIPPPTALVPEFQPKQFDGVWYITSGLNPTFDTFDCQVHTFKADGNKMRANLNWRVPALDGGFIERGAVQDFVQDPNQPGILYNHDNEFLHYQDDWYILAAQDEQKSDDYILVYYRGKNDAWDGYGGAVLYTRSKTLPESIVPQLREATSKVGLDFDRQFRTTDNTCGPPEPLLARIERAVEEEERSVVAGIQNFGQKVVAAGKLELDLLAKLKQGFAEVQYDRKRFLQELTLEEREFFESLKMKPSEIEALFGDSVPIRRIR